MKQLRKLLSVLLFSFNSIIKGIGMSLFVPHIRITNRLLFLSLFDDVSVLLIMLLSRK